MKGVIVIPARFASKRLPGKPLVLIGGKTMLARVVDVARRAIAQVEERVTLELYVATEDKRIADHAAELGVSCLLTSSQCKTGTDRIAEAITTLGKPYDFVVGLQGDAPLTPPWFIGQLVYSFIEDSAFDVYTPVVQLTWNELDAVRERKKVTPFSGTFALFSPVSGEAFWFSKVVVPAVRDEANLQRADPQAGQGLSPCFRHAGIYGWRTEMLHRFARLPEGHYEKLEGLEQLRVLENGYRIRCVPVESRGLPLMSGVDSPEDVETAERLSAAFSFVTSHAQVNLILPVP